MRAVLIVNPNATTTNERARDILVRAMRSAIDLTVEYTHRRGHATELARHAADQEYGLVVTLGGDGTVNETINGLLEDGRTANEAPSLAVVPGGSTNVFARSLGLPEGWVDGTGVILEALRDNRSRAIGLGKANGRYFTFCAGLGLDAAAIRRVERARMRGVTGSPSLYLRSAIAQFFSGSDRHHPQISMEIPGYGEQRELALAIAQNTTPWTYLHDRPISPNPRATFDTGLDVMAMRGLSVPATIRTASQLLTKSGTPSGSHVVAYHDLQKFRLFSGQPQAFQLDGDYLGECDEVELESSPGALRVVC